MGGVRRLQDSDVLAVAAIHETILPESIYSQIGRPFLNHYYRAMQTNDRFGCVVYEVDGQVVGFIAYSHDTGRVFSQELRARFWPLVRVLMGIVLANPLKLCVLARAIAFLFWRRRDMQPEVDGEILSFAVLPEYRVHAGDNGTGGGSYSAFFQKTQVAVARELFLASIQELRRRGVRRLKIMTGTRNVPSNRFYTQMGCRAGERRFRVFGEEITLYLGDLDGLAAGERG